MLCSTTRFCTAFSFYMIILLSFDFYAVFFCNCTEPVVIAVFEEDAHPLIDSLDAIALSAGFGSATVITQLLPFTFPAVGAAILHLSHRKTEELHQLAVS